VLKHLGNIESITAVLIAACYALWLCAGLLWTTPYWWVGMLILPWVAAFHTSLQHEAVHGHPTPWPLLNELLVSLPLAGVFPYRRYRDLHLLHHNDINLTDPYEDPESYFWPLASYRAMRPFMRVMFEINNTFAGRLIIGPVLTVIGFAKTEIRRFSRNEPGVRKAWAFHLLGLIVVLALVTKLFAMPLWIYLVAVIYPAISIASVRSYAEHQAAENVGGRTAIVETSMPWALLFLNNNLHIVHHSNPNLPWYEIPKLYRERKKQFLAANENTLFLGYGEIARRFAFRVKQPVQHPYLYCDEDTTK